MRQAVQENRVGFVCMQEVLHRAKVNAVAKVVPDIRINHVAPQVTKTDVIFSGQSLKLYLSN
jgi:hypothetical protein